MASRVGGVEVGYRDVEEFNRVGQEGVKGSQRCEMYWVLGIDVESLWG
jgi:hypothetical protein